MELNTINKTGTWSETADRINSNFSKISIEVEEIKQNGGGGSGGGGDVTNADHATSAYTLDKNTPVLDWFLSALNDDDAQGIINFLKGLKIAGNLINRIVKQGDKDVTYTDEDVMSALRVMTEIENSAEKLKEIFLRKDDSIEQLAALGCNSDTNRTLQKLGRMAHIGKKFTYHTSRHTCATLLVHQGVPITTVQKLLGHTSVKTTEIYSEVFDETIIKDLTRANQKYYNRRNVKQNQIKSQKYSEKYLRQ